jgi:hypothetical protein
MQFKLNGLVASGNSEVGWYRKVLMMAVIALISSG